MVFFAATACFVLAFIDFTNHFFLVVSAMFVILHKTVH